MEPQVKVAALQNNKNLIGEILRFAIVGVINTGVDFVILFVLIKLTGINEGNGLIPLNLVAFTAAVVNSYILNKRWAFKDHGEGQAAKKFSVFLIVSIIGSVVNTSILRLISTNVDPMLGLTQTQWTGVAKLFATGASLVWNFIGYKLFVFKK